LEEGVRGIFKALSALIRRNWGKLRLHCRSRSLCWWL